MGGGDRAKECGQGDHKCQPHLNQIEALNIKRFYYLKKWGRMLGRQKQVPTTEFKRNDFYI